MITATAVMTDEPSDKILRNKSHPSFLISCIRRKADSSMSDSLTVFKEQLTIARSSQNIDDVKGEVIGKDEN